MAFRSRFVLIFICCVLLMINSVYMTRRILDPFTIQECRDAFLSNDIVIYNAGRSKCPPWLWRKLKTTLGDVSKRFQPVENNVYGRKRTTFD